MPSRQLCVYCRRREVDDGYRPFCSERCKMADLGHWLTGEYRIAGKPDPGAADSPADVDAIDDEGADPTRR